jgi:hypothetical protein
MNLNHDTPLRVCNQNEMSPPWSGAEPGYPRTTLITDKSKTTAVCFP